MKAKLLAGALLTAVLVFSSAGTASAHSSFYFGFSVPLPQVYAAPAPPVYDYYYPGYYSGYYAYPRYYAPYPRYYRHHYPRPYRGYYHGPYIGGWWRVR